MAEEEISKEIAPLLDDLFRRQSAQLVSSLTRLFGASHLQLAEDMVQETLLKAMREWPYRGIPDEPAAWLFRVARNGAIDHLRRNARGLELLKANAALLRSEWTLSATVHDLMNEHSIADDQLRMLFACCHPSMAQEQQVALALRTLCGFSVPEIARAFVSNTETINKRLYRAREAFRLLGSLEIPDDAELDQRIDQVLAVIYLLFNEGYASTEHADLIREDLIEEALRLADQLIRHERTKRPEVHALLALMLFQASRSDARLDPNGAIVLLQDQDRSTWDRALIGLANEHLTKASEGEAISAYHVEAAIAAVHANAPDHAATDWRAVVGLYDNLLLFKPAPIVALNRAVAVAEADGPEAGLNEVGRLEGLEDHHLYHAVRGELLMRTSETSEALGSFERALELTRSAAERELLLAKCEACR